MSGASQIKRKWQHQTKMLFLYRLTLVFTGSSLSQNFHYPGYQDSICIFRSNCNIFFGTHKLVLNWAEARQWNGFLTK